MRNKRPLILSLLFLFVAVMTATIALTQTAFADVTCCVVYCEWQPDQVSYYGTVLNGSCQAVGPCDHTVYMCAWPWD